MTPRTDDYVKNLIRKMLVEEGYVRVKGVVLADNVPAPTQAEMRAKFRAARFDFPPPPHITIGPDCEPRVLEDA